MACCVGTLSFLAQDGDTRAVFTYTAAVQSGVATLHTSNDLLITALTGGNVSTGPDAITLGSCTDYIPFTMSNAECTFALGPSGGAMPTP
jgi:hypothetical protein